MPNIADRRGRPLRSLRVSVTDRCNLRCTYCMPGERFTWIPREDVLSFAEIERAARAFVRLGVTRLRLTGGEPLLRRDLPDLVRTLARLPGLEDLALTTNGVLLEDAAAELAAAGLDRMTVSLDSVDSDRLRSLTRHGDLARIQRGIQAAAAVGLPLKINTVVLRGVNEDELTDILDYGRTVVGRSPLEVRFVEYMEVGDSTPWALEKVVPRAEILERLGGNSSSGQNRGSAPAEPFTLPDGTLFGIVAATTAPFCGACDRARLTADGQVYDCLHARSGLDLRGALRAGSSDRELRRLIGELWERRDAAGAELQRTRRDAVGAESQRRGRRLPCVAVGASARVEMHVRGG